MRRLAPCERPPAMPQDCFPTALIRTAPLRDEGAQAARPFCSAVPRSTEQSLAPRATCRSLLSWPGLMQPASRWERPVASVRIGVTPRRQPGPHQRCRGVCVAGRAVADATTSSPRRHQRMRFTTSNSGLGAAADAPMPPRLRASSEVADFRSSSRCTAPLDPAARYLRTIFERSFVCRGNRKT